MFEDIYFLSPQEALNMASKQNRYGMNNYFLQLCYYEGEKIESDLPNLIHMPIETLVESLATGIYRIPTKLDFSGLELSSELKLNILTNFNISIEYAKEYRQEYNYSYLKTLQTSKLDFSEPLRFSLMANTSTQVMQYVTKNIADSLKERGYDVLFDLQTGIEDSNCLKKLANYNPHARISINNINNTFLSEDAFNFVWFQDQMPILFDARKIELRERDIIFSYANIYTKLLLKKGVDKNKIFKQEIIPVDVNEFYLDDTIKREDKIVFVGSYYATKKDFSISTDIDKELNLLLENGIILSEEVVEQVYKKHKMKLPEDGLLLNEIQQGYIRNRAVSWLCENRSKKVEVYGYSWQESQNSTIMKSFKGKAEKTDLNQIYNSAKYVLAASGRVINTQRLGEIVHAGAIPVIYDSRSISDEEETWDDECLYFKTKEELDYILDNNLEPKKYRSEKMLKYFTYDNFIKTIIDEIDKKRKA